MSFSENIKCQGLTPSTTDPVYDDAYNELLYFKFACVPL